MRKKIFIIGAMILSVNNLYNQTVMSPGQFLGYELGTRFTYHHMAVDYFKYVAGNSPLVQYREYGTTYEGRPLCVCFISSEANLEHFEEYRKNNLINAGMENGSDTGKQVPFIWLAYNVHGNESAGMESAMKTLYTLADRSFSGASEWLDSCIIIIDPCQNPDGRDLYTNRFRTSGNLAPNPDGNSWEHNQGWPGARTNHYMFDLNRDWAWQTQTETVQRIRLFNQIMPQVYADFHEMGAESTFFFAPGAEPWHEVITPWQHEFHKLMGKGDAELFDESMKLYFSKDTYDLFCPSFGDTWPLFNGSMGFTYEQGGGGSSGLAYKRQSGDTLTLKMRIDGHFLASMATLKVSYENRNRLISEFNEYFRQASEKPSFQYKSIIIKGTNDRSNLEDLFQLLGKNQIYYSKAGNIGKKYRGFDYGANSEGEVTIDEGDILVSAYQPQSHMVQVLFEPDSKSTDSLTYDLSAWALPYLYNLRAFAIRDKIDAAKENKKSAASENKIPSYKPYGYVVNYSGFNELKFIAALLQENIKPRYALKPFTIKGNNFERGSFIIARGDNKHLDQGFDKIVTQVADRAGIKLIPVSSGVVDEGKDFGSMYSPLMNKIKAAILCGEGTSQSQVGEIWYFFEREIGYPLSLINIENIGETDFSEYDVLILTSGNYSSLSDTVFSFVRKGGKVIAIENAISVFSSNKSTALFKAVELRNTERKAAEKKEKSDDPELLKKFEDERRYALSDRSAGSIYRVRIDDTHPYSFGLGKEWFVIKRTSSFPFLKSGSNVAYVLDHDPVAGFAGYKFRNQVANTLVVGSEKIGSGEAVYIADDPYFRAFWKSGRVLLANILFR